MGAAAVAHGFPRLIVVAGVGPRIATDVFLEQDTLAGAFAATGGQPLRQTRAIRFLHVVEPCLCFLVCRRSLVGLKASSSRENFKHAILVCAAQELSWLDCVRHVVAAWIE